MDRWKYFGITHRDHRICNPLASAKLDGLIDLLDLPAGARALDIACGKGETLLRLARRGVAGVGVDLSPVFINDARAAAAREGEARITWVEQDGAAYLNTAPPGSFDLTLCLGASWVFGGYRGTLGALASATAAGGCVVVGEPFWRRPPPPDYLAHVEWAADTFATHAGNVQIGVAEGLLPLSTVVSNDDDWDQYQGLQWRAAERYARAHPDDPDVPDLLARQRHSRDLYLRWERDILGWAVYLFQKP